MTLDAQCNEGSPKAEHISLLRGQPTPTPVASDGRRDGEQGQERRESGESGPCQTDGGSSLESGGRTQGARRPVFGWLAETSAIIFSAACLAAVVGVLMYENGKALEQWKLVIPPNALVSFVATLAKSACLMAITEIVSQLKWQHFSSHARPLSEFELFDAASRGPWGSCQLLVYQHYHTILASSAAVLTLVALLFDPFVQLAIRFPSKPFPVHDMTASFAVAAAYDPNNYMTSGPTTNTRGEAFNIYPEVQTAVLQGLYNTSWAPSFTCPTGKCTFSDLSTLAVCSTCTDITSRIAEHCTDNVYFGNSHPECTFAMPSGNNITSRIYQSGSRVLGTRTLWNSTAVSPGGNSSTSLCLVEAIRQLDTASGPPEPLVAWQCTLSFCEQTVSLNVTGGAIQSYTHKTGVLAKNDSSGVPDYSSNLKNLIELLPANGSNATGKSYYVNQDNWDNTGAYLSELFTTGLYADGSTTRMENATNNLYGDAVVSPLGLQFALQDNVPMAFEQLGASMTESLRRSPNTTDDSGEVLMWKSYIKVR